MRRSSKEASPTETLYQLRKAVSGILGRRFTKKIDHRVFKPDQRLLAVWAADCAERVLPYFEARRPDDGRPRRAIGALRDWAKTGVFSMTAVRKASLEAHAAARETDGDRAACFAAHAAGQAVATAHVPTHALGCAVYAVRAAASSSGIERGDEERDWQVQRLRGLVRTRESLGRWSEPD